MIVNNRIQFYGPLCLFLFFFCKRIVEMPHMGCRRCEPYSIHGFVQITEAVITIHTEFQSFKSFATKSPVLSKSTSFCKSSLQGCMSVFKGCVRYFSLFLKDKCISSFFRTKYIEKKFNLQLLFLPTVSRTFILSWATTCYPPP